jgi:DNA-binding transcriptional regulator YiaG
MIRMEIWKAVTLYEGYYEVSNFGIVRSVIRKINYPDRSSILPSKVLKYSLHYNGYYGVTLSKNNRQMTFMVHRLVAEAFVEKPENPLSELQVNHIDGNKTNNHDINLEWVTATANTSHAFRSNLRKSRKGTNNKMHKLNEEQVKEIRELDGKLPQSKIAILYNISQASVSLIMNNFNWRPSK